MRPKLVWLFAESSVAAIEEVLTLLVLQVNLFLHFEVPGDHVKLLLHRPKVVHNSVDGGQVGLSLVVGVEEFD